MKIYGVNVMFNLGNFESTKSDSENKSTVDSNPIGTILTVPLNAQLDGYIDFVSGSNFDKDIYPDLFKALGTNQFVSDTGNNINLPIGTIIPWLNSDFNIPTGFVEWKTYKQSLIHYPELVRVLTIMAKQLPEGESKNEWLKALEQNTFPAFEYSGFYLHGSENHIGLYETDTTKREHINVLPAVVDNSNLLSPLGVSRCTTSKEPVSVLHGNKLIVTDIPSVHVIPVNESKTFTDSVNKNLNQLVLGSGSETKPKSLNVRILVKAVSDNPSQISTTHKRIIKAY